MRLQRLKEREEKERLAEEAYQRKMKEEAQRKKEAEEMILLLENEEKELILRLRKTQEMQQEVSDLFLSIFEFRRLLLTSGILYLAAVTASLIICGV